MGLPQVNVKFAAAARSFSRRSQRGIVGMILKGEPPEAGNPLFLTAKEEIPAELDKETIQQIEFAFTGYTQDPRRVEVYFVPEKDEEAEDYSEALEYFAYTKVNYLCAPTCKTDGMTESIVAWVKEQRALGRKIQAVLPETEADHEGVINYTTPSVTVGGKDYGPEEFCSRIAGLLAGTPGTMSAAFAPIPEASDCTHLKRAEVSEEIDKGHFVVFYDGEKVKAASGVNSLVTLPKGKNRQFKKVRIVQAMDMINDDLVGLLEENYIGKYQNNYDNKCVILCAVIEYFTELQKEGAVGDFTVGIDIQANKEYLDSQGVNTSEMTEEELKKADTDEKLFLRASMDLVDAVEEITLNITV